MKSILDLSLEELAELARRGADQAADQALKAGIPVTGLRAQADGTREIVRHYPDGSEAILKSLEPSRLPGTSQNAKAIRGLASKR